MGKDGLPASPRSEEEKEVQLLGSMISNLSWILFPPKEPYCMLGRHPKPPDASSQFCASLYSMGKGALRNLELGPEFGATKLQAMAKLLYSVEVEIGKLQLKDARK
ncbi:hypothetical protein BDV95DRAFT_502440 [Massariosphaeria phaeospora]|uniref:Uncharacterized protein n=1 Tax=Massariosphaeria phaeospora TaxID=100035 RepID=A0A7C8M445_9PLEO|nr:hypothetical protein BDV95DRAFT_502440 [Massariosphaeria phaeospora]